jgi:hypothetical protein
VTVTIPESGTLEDHDFDPQCDLDTCDRTATWICIFTFCPCLWLLCQHHTDLTRAHFFDLCPGGFRCPRCGGKSKAKTRAEVAIFRPLGGA